VGPKGGSDDNQWRPDTSRDSYALDAVRAFTDSVLAGREEDIADYTVYTTLDRGLQVLAKFILVESLVILNRPLEAARYFQEAEPLCRDAGRAMQLRALYFEARLLDGLGHVRESEKLFRAAIKSYFDDELYKEAFITLLTLFESFCRRGALGKAAALCEAAIAAASESGEACNDQIRKAWEDLHAAVRIRQLSEEELVHARRPAQAGGGRCESRRPSRAAVAPSDPRGRGAASERLRQRPGRLRPPAHRSRAQGDRRQHQRSEPPPQDLAQRSEAKDPPPRTVTAASKPA